MTAVMDANEGAVTTSERLINVFFPLQFPCRTGPSPNMPEESAVETMMLKDNSHNINGK